MKWLKQIDITLIYVVAGIAMLLGAGILVYTFAPRSFGESPIISLPTFEKETDTCEFRRQLDGVCVAAASGKNSKLIAVMVENHFESWPQSGVADARVVYEAPVEGNISRFLLLYTEDQEIDKVGPVRSARPYYLDWVAEYGTPLYVHVGGSPAALDQIKQYGVNDFNEFFRGWYFWRDTNRYAPHNAYTSSDLWTDALEEYADNYTTTTYDGWQFGDVDVCTENCVNEIEVVYSGNTYTAGWAYNTTTESFFRSQAGSADLDSDGTQVVADTVIVQYVDTTVLDGVGRLGMDTVGTGSSTVFQKGHAIVGEWRKPTRTARTRFFDESGEEVVLNPGKIWVQVINRDTVEYR